ncbi:MAG: HlyC/CorC family transporter [Erysipelotrichales bacterium]|nr:HlyC/CorC family transporter [Erysipelotrichales bacterium]
MADGPWPYIIIVLLLIFGSYFAASETAFSSCNRVKLRVLADDGNKAAKTAEKIAEKFDKYLVAILIGTNIVSVLTSMIATNLFINKIITSSENTASIVATIVTTVVVYIFVESVPKCIARANANKFALFSARILRVFYIITYPIGLIFVGLNKLFEIIFRVKSTPEITEDDFTNVIEDIEDKGIIEEEESEIIQSAFDFGETKVREVLTPLEKMFAIDINKIDHESLNEIIINTTYTRIPVYSKNINNIIGILHVKKYLSLYLNNKKTSIRGTLSKPYIVTGQITMDRLFEGFKKHKTHIAIVRNKNHETIGMVTMEDLLEELVGDVSEAHNENLKKGGNK